jgi:hypothetical protein
MFQFPCLPLRTLFYSGASTTALPVVGFPIRRSRGQRLVSTSPELFAAAHVLLRLLAPRHPPCALSLLIVKNSLLLLWSFQGALRPAEGRSLKTQQRGHSSKDFHQNEPSSLRSNSSGIPRKEVIQPQLPLRLPCYDFTPIIDPTFDGSLPCGLGHRLRVLPTFVV